MLISDFMNFLSGGKLLSSSSILKQSALPFNTLIIYVTEYFVDSINEKY